MTKRVFVIMHDETQQVCPVEANNAEEARVMIAEKLGCDVSGCPVYDAENDEDMQIIISIVQDHIDKCAIFESKEPKK